MMTATQYVVIIKIFMVLMPIELAVVIVFSWACIEGHHTHQPAFWYALMCIGVLVPEIFRGLSILSGSLPPYPKDLCLWALELAPFGGFMYEVGKRYLQKLRSNSRND